MTRPLKDQIDAGGMRRIGARHAIVLPERKATVLDLAAVTAELAECNKRLRTIEAKRARVVARRDQLQKFRDEFAALTVDRDEGDPVVPQAAPAPSREVPLRRVPT